MNIDKYTAFGVGSNYHTLDEMILVFDSIMGMSIAKGCEIQLSNGTDIGPNSDDDPNTMCDLSGEVPFHLFSTWENIVESLDIN